MKDQEFHYYELISKHQFIDPETQEIIKLEENDILIPDLVEEERDQLSEEFIKQSVPHYIDRENGFFFFKSKYYDKFDEIIDQFVEEDREITFLPEQWSVELNDWDI